MEVGICAELNLISLKSDYHEMRRDSRLKIIKESEKLDFSMGAWNITPKVKLVLQEIKDKYPKSISFKIELLEKESNRGSSNENYYHPW